MTPRYRADIVGNIKASIAEFEDSVRGELANPERMEFLLAVEDSQAYQDWKDYLTEAEMKAAFKGALAAPGVTP